MKLEVELKAELEVEFTSPTKVYEYFIEGDWKDTFYTYSGLEDLASSLAHDLFNASNEFCSELKTYKRFVEGYGYFVEKEGFWVCTEEDEFGTISIKLEELEIDSCTELDS